MKKTIFILAIILICGIVLIADWTDTILEPAEEIYYPDDSLTISWWETNVITVTDTTKAWFVISEKGIYPSPLYVIEGYLVTESNMISESYKCLDANKEEIKDTIWDYRILKEEE